MSHALVSPHALAQLLTSLAVGYDVAVGGGLIRILGRKLAGPAACGILPDLGDGVLRVVYDPNKPRAMDNVIGMLRDWYESYQEPVVGPDGVQLVPRALPELGDEPVSIYATP